MIPSVERSRSAGREAEEYLTKEQWITRLLSEHDGMMWQGEIVGETGWTASTTSRVLAKLEDEERVVRQQIGRQKIVSLGSRPIFQ